MTENKNLDSLVEENIILIRGERVLLDEYLAQLYGVETRVLIQAVKRNIDRFPSDFMIQLSDDENKFLRSQIVISKSSGGRRYLPYAFTEQGVAMLSSVLRSKKAIQVNIEIMRAFVKLRQILSVNDELKARVDELEERYDENFRLVFEAIRRLMAAPESEQKNPIGFISE